MSDLIDRQKAIDELHMHLMYRMGTESNKQRLDAWINNLPPAQPERTEERTETHACDLISRQAAIDTEGLNEEIRCEMCRNPIHTDRGCDGNCKYDEKLYEKIIQILDKRIKPLQSAQPEWNNHTVACFLAELYGDTCACNYNDIDEWLPEKCEVIDACPNPVGVACWEQFLKHRAERKTDEQIRGFEL